jgi:hypothetical protein
MEFQQFQSLCILELFCIGGVSRRIAVYRGFWRVLARPNSPKTGPAHAELIFSAAG